MQTNPAVTPHTIGYLEASRMADRLASIHDTIFCLYQQKWPALRDAWTPIINAKVARERISVLSAGIGLAKDAPDIHQGMIILSAAYEIAAPGDK